MSMKNSNDTVGNRTRDLPACSTVLVVSGTNRNYKNWNVCVYIYVYIWYYHICILNFADDQVLLAEDHDDMAYMARKQKEEYEKWGLTINVEKN